MDDSCQTRAICDGTQVEGSKLAIELQCKGKSQTQKLYLEAAWIIAARALFDVEEIEESKKASTYLVISYNVKVNVRKQKLIWKQHG